jgi:hypothetical protein
MHPCKPYFYDSRFGNRDLLKHGRYGAPVMSRERKREGDYQEMVGDC